ncbi:hypothetical protein AKJ39_01900 [candidate division MSBL1 archaeon SCGC-AAA259J03]|uniref:dolichyl-phosphooligosaccharide-protein glycotransferase n=1 Tax=candidate division MSBL1 archaeon SCGC-AAA259J03 TaxID=1698269 RepID=A0A656YWK2_9EURY|nr:hypothetical protein AKJ39_01900 [candidate division MSBL1 archaeon SCGC-AAA259J03]
MTTSDSGYFYGIAREINHQNGFIQDYELSHPPQGKNVAQHNQFQPLMLVTLYRGLHALDPSLGLMDVCKYFSPLFFALSVIGAFLAAREFGGDLAGCASALFFSTLVGTIYWTKIGAFDREITLVFFGTWLFYLVGRVFQSKEIREIIKYSAVGGIFYGFFIATWPGAPILGAIIVLALILLILERAVSGLGFTVVGIILFVLGNTFPKHFDISEFLGLFLLLAGLAKIAMDWESVKEIESSIVSGFRSNWKTIGGILCFVIVSTLVGVAIGEYEATFWLDMFTERIPSFIGIAGGEGGVSFPTYASEAQPLEPPTLGNYFNFLNIKLYGNVLLTGITIALVGLAIGKIFLSTSAGGLFALSWLIVVAPMPLAQTRFIRLFWPLWPVLAGLGVGFLLKWGRDFTFSSLSTSDFLEKLRHPILLAIVFLILVTPFIQNARVDSHTSETQPVPHGGSLPTNFYHSLLDSFNWIENNTPEDSVITIPWSYGHFATGATGRPSVTDGAETLGWRGEWQDSDGIKPPDYIKYIAPDGSGKIIGVNAPIRENQVNGRRIDVQRMSTTGNENVFAFIVNTYRENYNVKMDYFVFNNSVSGGASMRTSVLINTAQDMETTQKVKSENMDFVFNFEQENIKYNFLGTPTTQENENLAGIVYYNVDSRQIINYQLNPDFEESKILWVFLSRQEGIVQLTQNLYVRAGGLAKIEGIPMITRALDDYQMPDYLKEVYRSPKGQAAVYKIIHENASKYS